MTGVDDFLRRIGATMQIIIDDEHVFFDDNDDEGQDVYRVRIRRNGKQFLFFFAQALEKTKKGEEPTAYDVLSSLICDDENYYNSTKGRRVQKGMMRVFGDVLDELKKIL